MIERAELIEQIFSEALECEPSEQAAFLAKACHRDTKLQHEIESLLDSYSQNENFLQAPAFDLSVIDITKKVIEEDSLAIGKNIGSYRIERQIGCGGMGAVYLATRADGQFNKQVAIKLLRGVNETEEIVRRFHNERQILADLEHPFIARLIDGGTTENGTPYFVMEYVEGVPVDRYCDEQNLSLEERLELFRKICSAVEFAHQSSVIHRDIKPSNILVAENGEPKLLDFGIAKVLNSNQSVNTNDTTATAFRVMTPNYASPEQIRGEKIGRATDIYSLGVLLYKLLTGNRPYQLDGKSPYEIAQVICEAEPVPPSFLKIGQRSITTEKAKIQSSNRKLLKGDLDKIVLKSLRKEPERRYASAKEFSEDIACLLKGLPVSARQDTIFYRSVRFFRRHQTAVLSSLGAAFVFLLVGFSLNLLNNQTVVDKSSAAGFPENIYQNLTIEKNKGGTDNAEARELYLRAQSLWEQRTMMSLREAKELFLQATQKDPEFALAYSGLSNTFFLLSVWGNIPANEIFPEAKAASLKAIELAPEAAEGHLSLAIVHWLYEYDWQAADREFTRAIELNPNYGRASHWYGLFLAEMGRFDEAIAAEKRALEIEPQSLPVKADLARVLFYARRYDESLAQYREILSTNPYFGAVYAELLQLYEAAGMTNEWLALMKKTGALEKTYIRKAYETGGMKALLLKEIEMQQNSEISDWHRYYTLATLYAQINDKDSAFEFFNKAIEVRDHRMAQIKVHPNLDNIRSDPRFAELLRLMNFETSQ